MTVPADAGAVPIPSGARRVEDRDELLRFFSDDRAVHLYPLVDLDEPFWSASRWFRRGDAVVGVVATPGDGIITATGVSTRDPVGSSELLAEVATHLPAGLMLTGPTGMAAAIGGRRGVGYSGSHVKYELVDRGAVPAPDARLVPLGDDGVAADVARLERLYAIEPGAAFFLPSMIGDRSFVGLVGADGELEAAAGTHLLSESQRLAAIGSVYVRPARRGAGLGRIVTAGAIARIVDRCDVIGLNVATDNVPARRIYESLGFRNVLEYEEAVLA